MQVYCPPGWNLDEWLYVLSRNSPGLKPSILRHSAIWWAADEALLNKVRKSRKNPPLKGYCVTFFPKLFLISGKWQGMLRYSVHQWCSFLSGIVIQRGASKRFLILIGSWSSSGVNDTGDLRSSTDNTASNKFLASETSKSTYVKNTF